MQNEPRLPTETIFESARSREAGPERQAYLDGACGGDADLRSRVDQLLSAHDEASEFLESPAVKGSQEGPGSRIGPYKLLQEIGEGGMGVVYMAEQESPVRRKVALKVIKLGMDTKQVIARFEAERQALAMMDHAHIARVLDAGATESGRPYFVMELVRGVPINEYCDNQKLSTVERLQLFVSVCRAVQHAHQKGIIHRDLKPTNVLVTSHDGTPIPKIIDFGVAKATNQRLTERTLFTEFQQIIGTPEYMSPEQAEMSGTDVDTRSDIYALGVLLYQLLTGTTPVDPKALRTAGYEEMTRMIREDEAPAPSTRISKLGSDSDKIARYRGSDAGSLSRHFRGDLDWIVMKALEKDRTRRYETASAFAEDVLRHLADLPVVAGPPGVVYRVRKFVHRNRKAVLAASVLVAVVGLGLAGTIAGFLEARAEAQHTRRINDSLQDVLAMTDPARAADRDGVEHVLATVREVFGEDHATYAAVLDTLAAQVHGAGDFAAAADLYRESLAVWTSVYGEQHPNVAIAHARLGASLRAQGDDENAEVALRAALATLDEAAGLAGYEPRMELADLLANRGMYAEANELFGESLAILRQSPDPPRFRMLETLEQRFVVQLNDPSLDGRATLRAIYDETHDFYPENSPLRAISALGYGRYVFQHGESATAEPYLREALQHFRTWSPPPKVYFATAADALFQIMRSRTDLESVAETDDLLRETIKISRGFTGPRETAANLVYYGSRMAERGRFGDALDAVLDAYQVLVDGDRSVDEREGVRDKLTMVAFQAAFRPGLGPEVYSRAHEAITRALIDEPGKQAMVVVLGAVLYRQDEFALAAVTLDLPTPLAKSSGGLARGISPADHAFRAMANAQLGNDAIARAELAALRAALGADEFNTNARNILREAEAVVEHSPSSDGDD